MYREIKFRAWDKKEMKMKINLRLSDLWIYYEDVGLNNIFNNDDIIFLQYTWLKDKNWKDIYENDIVFDTLNKKIWEVKMNEFWRYSIYWKDWDRMNSYHWEAFNSWIYPDNTLEVKGNVFENPDLLTK